MELEKHSDLLLLSGQCKRPGLAKTQTLHICMKHLYNSKINEKLLKV